MSPHNPTYQLKNVAVILTGVALLMATYLTTTRLFTTYISIENDRAESFWSIVQLQKELDAMYYQTELYRANALDRDALQLRYELLWSRFPVVQNMLEKDEILKQINGLADDVQLIFDNIKVMEAPILRGQTLEPAQLTTWIKTLAIDKNRMNSYIIHNMSGFDGDYVAITANKLLANLVTIATLITAIILYLGFLVSTLILQQRRNRYLLAHDSLTGLKSRSYILKAISRRCQQKQPFTLINFDLNEFKQINDNYGHQTGDQVLLHISGLFKKTLATQGEVGRVGGDEFLWLTDITDKSQVNEVHGQLLAQLHRSFMTENNEAIQLKISAGAGFSADYNFDEDLLKDEVDKAMYCAKSSKMPGVCWKDTLDESTDTSPVNYSQNDYFPAQTSQAPLQIRSF